MSPSVVSVWAVLFAAIVSWLAGFGWYSLWAGRWASAVGTNLDQVQRERDAKAGTVAGWRPYVLIFVAELVMAWVLAFILDQSDVTTLSQGVVMAAVAWLGLIAVPLTINNMLAGRTPMLTLIDGGHWLLVLVVMGAILGRFG
jgi:hypothetical protein